MWEKCKFCNKKVDHDKLRMCTIYVLLFSLSDGGLYLLLNLRSVFDSMNSSTMEVPVSDSGCKRVIP